jgi:hypothetical protein
MKCPKCNREMELKSHTASFDLRLEPKKKYHKSVYWCEKDDVWVGVEIPEER